LGAVPVIGDHRSDGEGRGVALPAEGGVVLAPIGLDAHPLSRPLDVSKQQKADIVDADLEQEMLDLLLPLLARYRRLGLRIEPRSLQVDVEIPEIHRSPWLVTKRRHGGGQRAACCRRRETPVRSALTLRGFISGYCDADHGVRPKTDVVTALTPVSALCYFAIGSTRHRHGT